MMKQILTAAVLVTFIVGNFSAHAADEWHPTTNPIMTQWAEKVDPAHPLPEYPRPQMVRKEWTNLNGLWDYAITPMDAAQPAKWDGKILVPFCVESALSGVKKPLDKDQRLWYRRTFSSPDLAGGKRLLLHFGAVDWQATVSINGKEVGSHKGGYDSFSYDITDALKPGDNELLVNAWDPTGANGAPHGKQRFAAIAKPGGIFYTPCSGIWQTVWMEAVPEIHVDRFVITPDLDGERVTIGVVGNLPSTNGPPQMGIAILDDGKEIARGEINQPIAIPKPHVWSPEDPHLYTFHTLPASRPFESYEPLDGYFAMRKISLAKDDKGVLRLALNNKPLFMSGPLDQGFWPDGIYTAPTDEALKYDIEITKKLGFNCTRKHVKVEPERWYYWCDKLGLIVWQDMPGGGVAKNIRRDSKKDGVAESEEKAKQFEAELKAMIAQLSNHPSIVMWVVFNEGWGEYDTPRMAKWVKELDPTRLVNSASGWEDQNVGDVHDMHHYPAPAVYPTEESRASVLGEFGGLGLPIPGHKWVESGKNWGYQNMTGDEALTAKYIDLWHEVWKLRKESGLSAAIYTQLTDVETESNGLLSYDRKVIKINAAKSAAAITGSPEQGK